MIEEDANLRYDKVRCRCCGHNWEPFKDEHGRIHRGHPYGQTCSRYRPAPPEFGLEDLANVTVHVNGEAHT